MSIAWLIHYLFLFHLLDIQYALSFSPGRSSNIPLTTRPPLAIDRCNEDEPIEKVLIIMDGTCPYHSGYMAGRALDIPGVAVVYVLSDYLRGFFEQQGQEDEETLLRLQCPRTPEDAILWKSMLDDPSIRLIGVYCESDSGLAQAEQLRQLLEVECQDDPTILSARRDKHLMYEVAKASGLAVPDTKLCQSCDDAVDFAEKLMAGNGRVVVKPYRGVASESVFLCTTRTDVQKAWEAITSSSVFGAKGFHENALVQEFVHGTEYAIDVVSRNGEHKVMAVWRYCKKPANGASFCYFKTELVDASMDDQVNKVCQFASDTLSALGIKWGISHNECIVTENGIPTLVEVNHRQHNMDVCPLVMACIGYNIFDVALVAYCLEEETWAMIPDTPTLRAYGCMVHLVNYAQGKLVAIHHMDVLRDLGSVLDYEVYDTFQAIGSTIEPTVDIRTDAGWVQLVSESQQELDRDFATIEGLMPTMFQTEV